jgi:hypothetical protein
MSLIKFKLHFIYDDRLYMYKHIIDLEKKVFFLLKVNTWYIDLVDFLQKKTILIEM